MTRPVRYAPEIEVPVENEAELIAPDNLPSLKLAARVGYRPYAETTYNGHGVRLFERPCTAP